MVSKYESKNSLSKGQDSQIVDVKDIAPDVQENSTTITSAEIVAVPNLVNTRVVSTVS